MVVVHVALDADVLHVNVGVVGRDGGILLRAIDEVLDVHDGQGEPLERRWSLQLRVEVRAIIFERGLLPRRRAVPGPVSVLSRRNERS